MIYLCLGLLFLELTYFFWANPVKWPEINLWPKLSLWEQKEKYNEQLSTSSGTKPHTGSYEKPDIDMLYIEDADIHINLDDTYELERLVKTYNSARLNFRDGLVKTHNLAEGQGVVIGVWWLSRVGYVDVMDDEGSSVLLFHCPSIPGTIGETIEFKDGECEGHRFGSLIWLDSYSYSTIWEGSIKLTRIDVEEIRMELDVNFYSNDTASEKGQKEKTFSKKGTFEVGRKSLYNFSP